MEQLIFEPENRTRDSGGDLITIMGGEHFHLARVLRVMVGERILVTDGNGTSCLCTVKKIAKDQSTCEVIEEYRNLNSSVRKFCIGVAVLKPHSKLELLIEKCTELGASRFMLFNSERTEKSNLRLSRLNSVLRAAVKQSLQSKFPDLQIVNNLEDVALQSHVYDEKFVLHEKSNTMVDEYLSGLGSQKSAIALVGPEGGFSETEIDLMAAKGFKACSLGKPRLRSETAAIKMASLLASYHLEGNG